MTDGIPDDDPPPPSQRRLRKPELPELERDIDLDVGLMGAACDGPVGPRRCRGPERASEVRRSAAERPDRSAGRSGGEGGIRTRDGLPRTAFPVRRHSPLGDLSRTRQDRSEAHRPVRSVTSAGGEGGIRTRGAFAHRFSRAAPSTTRTPLRPRGYQTPLGPTRSGRSVRRSDGRASRRTAPRPRRAGCRSRP